MSLKFAFKVIYAYLKKFRKIVFLGLLLGVVIFSFITFFLPFFSSIRVGRVGVIGKYQAEELPEAILGKITGGLTFIDNSGNPQPDMAESWEEGDSGKKWTFKLKDSLYWQDGQKVSSKSIFYEFTDVTIERPDDTTLIFNLEENYSPFPSVLSKPVFKKGLLGTGEWRVEKLSLVGSFVEKLTLKNKDKTTLTYKFYPTQETAKLAFKLGEVDEVVNLLDVSPFDSWSSAKVSAQVNTDQVVTIFFNTSDSLLGEKNIRQALFYAIEKEKMGERALSPISPNSWAYNPQVKPYNYDLERGKELLSSISSELLGEPQITLLSSPTLLQTAEKIAKDWERLGVKTHVEISTIVPSQFQAYLTIFDIPKDPDQYPIWHSTRAGTNISRYSNPRIDKILEDGRTELNREERKKLYLDFQRFLLEDVPAAFLYHPTYYNVIRV